MVIDLELAVMFVLAPKMMPLLLMLVLMIDRLKNLLLFQYNLFLLMLGSQHPMKISLPMLVQEPYLMKILNPNPKLVLDLMMVELMKVMGLVEV